MVFLACAFGSLTTKTCSFILFVVLTRRLSRLFCSSFFHLHRAEPTSSHVYVFNPAAVVGLPAEAMGPNGQGASLIYFPQFCLVLTTSLASLGPLSLYRLFFQPYATHCFWHLEWGVGDKSQRILLATGAELETKKKKRPAGDDVISVFLPVVTNICLCLPYELQVAFVAYNGLAAVGIFFC